MPSSAEESCAQRIKGWKKQFVFGEQNHGGYAAAIQQDDDHDCL